MTASPFISLHITKTAGGTLKVALSELKDRRVEMVYNRADQDRLRDQGLSGVDLIYGHAIYGLHERLGIPPVYGCFLRHPLTRTISHYFHLRNVDKGPVGEMIRQSPDINAFFETTDYWEFTNLQLRIISGLGNQPMRDPQATMNRARDHLARTFRFVGFQEFFPISVRKLSKVLGTDITLAQDINIGHYALKDVSPATIDKIETLNALDMQLYRECLAKYL